MKKDMFKMFMIVILEMTVLSCESSKEISDNYVEGRIIGFDPCNGGSDAAIEGRGFVIALNNCSDTLVTYNLPVNLFTFPKELFSGYLGSFLFPDTARNSYKIRFQYRFSSDNEKVHPICLGTIYLADYNKYVRDRQIVVENVSKNKDIDRQQDAPDLQRDTPISSTSVVLQSEVSASLNETETCAGNQKSL